MTETGTSTGYFLIADISGYTRFMAETEIDHATGVLEGLFAAVIPAIRPPLSVAGMQGDAVLAHAPDGEALRGQFMLEAIEGVYCEFADARERMRINTTCPCKACASIGDLDLKIILHHGESVEQETGGRRELAGRDVITAFRLLKNSVAETDGLTAYGLVTCDAVAAMGLAGYFRDNAKRRDTYDHIGEVEYVVHPLREAWLRRRDKRRIFVASDDELLIEERSVALPISPAAAFAVVSRPDLRQRWAGADELDVTGDAAGRVGEGAVYHCRHGRELMAYEIVDWRPGEYVTVSHLLPFGARALETDELSPVGDGTLARIRFGAIRGGSFLGRALRPMLTWQGRRAVAGFVDAEIPRLARMAEEMRVAEPSIAPAAPPDPATIGVGEALAGRFGA